MSKNNNSIPYLILIGIASLVLTSSNNQSKLQELKNSHVISNSTFSDIYKELNQLDSTVQKIYSTMEQDRETVNKKYGLFSINVLTITNNNGEKKSYLITESSLEEREINTEYKNSSFGHYEKYFEDIPDFYVTHIETITYSRVGKNGESPIIFKERILAQNKSNSYEGEITRMSSIYGSYESRSIYKITDEGFELDSSLSYEKLDSEFNGKIKPLNEVLGVDNPDLSFTANELADIEDMINDINTLTLS